MQTTWQWHKHVNHSAKILYPQLTINKARNATGVLLVFLTSFTVCARAILVVADVEVWVHRDTRVRQLHTPRSLRTTNATFSSLSSKLTSTGMYRLLTTVLRTYSHNVSGVAIYMLTRSHKTNLPQVALLFPLASKSRLDFSIFRNKQFSVGQRPVNCKNTSMQCCHLTQPWERLRLENGNTERNPVHVNFMCTCQMSKSSNLQLKWNEWKRHVVLVHCLYNMNCTGHEETSMVLKVSEIHCQTLTLDSDTNVSENVCWTRPQD